MYNKTDDQLLIMKYKIDVTRHDSDEKISKQYYKLDKLTEMVKHMMDQIQISNYSP